MEILNYTGKDIGILTKRGYQISVLSAIGNPSCEYRYELLMESDTLVPIYKKIYVSITGLPNPDPNKKVCYIVSEEIIQAIGRTRHDLLSATGSERYNGGTYYNGLVFANRLKRMARNG